MRLLVLTIITVMGFANSANATTSIDRETANKYFEACVANEDPRFTKDTQELFCACTSVHLMERYTMEDMRDSSRPDQIGRDATNKMITNVYAPCIKYPAKEYHYNQCLNSGKIRLLGDPKTICSCSAEQVAAVLERDGQQMLIDIIEKTPNIIDPMRAVYDDREFQKMIEQKALSCITDQ